MHKWHANVPELESERPYVKTQRTYAKEHLDSSADPEFSLLGQPWNKEEDDFSVVIPEMK